MSQALAPVAFGFIPGAAGVDLTPADLTPASSTTLTFPNSGSTLVVINNGSASPLTVVPSLARGVQGVTPTLTSYSLPAGKTQAFGPFKVADFGSTVTVTIGATATINVGAFEMTSA